LQIGKKKFLYLFKNKIIFNFVFVAKKVDYKNYFPSSVAVVGSGIRVPGWKKFRIRDKHPGSATLLD
jgi:hypothetical protein